MPLNIGVAKKSSVFIVKRLVIIFFVVDEDFICKKYTEYIHYTFRKEGCMPITIPKHEPIKKVYVEMVRQIVESEAKNDEEAE